MKTKKQMRLIAGVLAIILASSVVALKAACPGKATTGGKCTASSGAGANNDCVRTDCDQDSTVTGTCAEDPNGSDCSTYTVNYTCNKTQYPKTSSGDCNSNGNGTSLPKDTGKCTLTSNTCS